MLRSVLAISLCVLLFAPCRAAEDAPHIAVVNVARVFDAYLKAQAIKASLKQMIDKRNEEFKTQERKLKEWEYRLRMDPRDPKTSVDLFKEIQAFDLERFEYEAKVRDFAHEKNEREKTEMKSVIDDIQGAIDALRKAENLDLVLRAPDGPAPKGSEPQNVEEMVLRWRESQVLSHAPKVDLTAKIITSLNEEYKKAGR